MVGHIPRRFCRSSTNLSQGWNPVSLDPFQRPLKCISKLGEAIFLFWKFRCKEYCQNIERIWWMCMWNGKKHTGLPYKNVYEVWTPTRNSFHWGNVICMDVIASTLWLFVQQVVWVNSNEKSKVENLLAVVTGFHRWPMISPHKKPAMQRFDILTSSCLNRNLIQYSP